MKLYKILLPLLLSLLVGCAQTVKNNPPSQISQTKNLDPEKIETDKEDEKEVVDLRVKVAMDYESEISEYPDSIESRLITEVCLPELDDIEVPLGDDEAVADGFLENGELQEDPSAQEEKPSFAKKNQPNLDEALELCQMAQDLWQEGDLDCAIDALDHAYSLVLRVDTDDSPKLIQQTDDLRFMISKRILEIYASRHIVVSGNHKAIPVEINEHVQDEIDRFTRGGMKYFIRAYKRSGKYRPLIVEELKKAGLPEELSWLPLIESGYKNNALSKARALGLWQFIPSTGYKFGLKRDHHIDERMDPEKSTRAAIGYLSELHKIFGDWSTVLAAYNCGEARVLRVIRAQNVNYLDNFWDLYKRLPRETARYVPKFLATLHIVNNPEKYGLDLVDVCPPQKYETVKVSKQIHLKKIAETLDFPEALLYELNTELRYKVLPKTEYALKIPVGAGEQLIAKIESIPAATVEQEKVQQSKRQSRVRKYTVRRGDTLSKIAKRFGTKVKTIMRANGLGSKHFIVAGDVLKIPGKDKYYSKKKSYTKSKPKIYVNKTTVRHVVKQGDSLWIIARRYGTTTKKIRKLNNLPNARLHIGQILKIKAAVENGYRSSKTSKGNTYQVKNGDVPSTIAKKHDISLNKFLKLNRLTAHSKIYPGQMLFVE